LCFTSNHILGGQLEAGSFVVIGIGVFFYGVKKLRAKPVTDDVGIEK